jgi:hypothetical protein
MSATASLNMTGDTQHFHRNGDQFPHFQNKQDEKKHSHSHSDKPVHKRPRRSHNPNHSQPNQMMQQYPAVQDPRGPPGYRQDIAYSYAPSPNPSNFPPEMNFSQFSGNFPISPAQLSFGQLNASQQMNSLPNMPMAANQPLSLLNENMMASFPPHSTLPQLQLPLVSPLGFDIGSMSNLPTLLAAPNVTEQINARQAMLEQLKAQELAQQQQLLKLQPVKKIPSQEFVSEPTAPTATRPSHNDILKQHNEEYRLKQMKKAAVQQASSRYGYYTGQPESSHFNFIVPSLPTKYLLETPEDPDKT